MAACQPTVRGFLIFHVTDETDYNRWQSGVYYVDGTPKSTRAVRQADDERDPHRGVRVCRASRRHGTGGWTLATPADIAAPTSSPRAVGGWILVNASSG